MPNIKPGVTIPSTLNIDAGDLPEIAEWKVGQTYKLEVTARLTSLRENDPTLVAKGDDDAELAHGQFEVESVEYEGEEEEEPEVKEKKKEILKKAVMSYRTK